MGLIVAGNLDGKAEAVGIACFCQQLHRLIRVVGVGISHRRVKILAEGGVHGRTHLCTVAVRSQIQHTVHIHRIAQGLTDQLVVKRRHSIVQVDGLDQIHGAFQNSIPIGQVVYLIHGQMRHQIQTAAVQRIEQSGAVLIDLVGHPVQLCTFAIVGIVPLQDQILLNAAGNILERTGTHRRGSVVGIALRQDIHAGHRTEKIAVGLRQCDGNHIAVNRCLHNSGKRRYHVGINGSSSAGFERIKHIVRGADSSIVEHHTITKGKGIGQTVAGDLHLGSNRLHEIAIRIGLDQTLKDVEHDLSSSCCV